MLSDVSSLNLHQGRSIHWRRQGIGLVFEPGRYPEVLTHYAYDILLSILPTLSEPSFRPHVSNAQSLVGSITHRPSLRNKKKNAYLQTGPCGDPAVWTSPLDHGGPGDRECTRMSVSPSDDSQGQEWPSDGREKLPFVVSDSEGRAREPSWRRGEKGFPVSSQGRERIHFW